MSVVLNMSHSTVFDSQRRIIEDTINHETVSEIERQLDPYDLVSLVFLLYDTPQTALQRLIVFKRISKEGDLVDLNLLHEWAVNAKSRSSWKQEFVEALSICQLYRIIHRSLGLDSVTIKNYYKPDELQHSVFINPVKKILYKLCESITSENFSTIKKTLQTYNVDTSEYCYIEETLLKLMSDGIISVPNINKVSEKSKIELNNLLDIINSFPELKIFVKELRTIARKLNNDSGTQIDDDNLDKKAHLNEPTSSNFADNDNVSPMSFRNEFNNIANIDVNSIDWDSDKIKNSKEIYPIKNPERTGICYIINQETFYPSATSIKNKCPQLKTRTGSTKDKIVLKKTMQALKFYVESDDNLTSTEIFEKIEGIIKHKLRSDDSVFMLCILSHGIRGHILGADSIKVSVDRIQKLLDSSKFKLYDIPKILIIQACQVDDEKIYRTVVADSAETEFRLKKKDFLIFWATAPEFEAYRNEKKGSIFIQRLCAIIIKNFRSKHFLEICTKINYSVSDYCSEIRKDQMPLFKSTLVKNLYFPQ